MSRVAKSTITLPTGVDVKRDGKVISVKGPKGELTLNVNPLVEINIDGSALSFQPTVPNKQSWSMAGTTRSLVNNMVVGVTSGFVKKLELKGVGYRAQSKGKVLNLTLGFSHPVEHKLPEGVVAETPSQTEIVLKSIDKQLLGQTAAEIRQYRPPEPYKGKGVRYADEAVRRKEAKKK